MNCKNCGAELFEQNAVDGVIECEYCFSRYPVARKEASPAALEFLRMGEHDLDTGRFDDAYAAYEKAAQIDKEEPEAQFGMALALFKVQYLKDEVNNRLQPICHELTEKKFQEDSRYLSALNLATEAQRKEYVKRAEEIDYIRSEFVELKKTGLDFDCFLCVKVTGADGEKTEDSKDADYIYDLLKDRGYKPFYSERNIRNRTGADYEAMILYALHTAETMLVVCREEDYLQTPWVKNEYARFLRLLNDSEKENDAVTIVYYEKPIEKLAGKRGKIQGIDFSRRDADRKICDFVESHTAEAKIRRQREEEEKKKREEKLLREIEEQKRAREELEARLNSMQTQKSVSPPSTPKQEPTVSPRKAEPRVHEFDNAPTVENYDREEFEIEKTESGYVLKKYNGKNSTVFIPVGVTKIGEEAFPESVTDISIPDSVKSIDANAVLSCNSLKFKVYENLKYLGNSANPYYACIEEDKPKNSYTLHEKTKVIADSCFDRCEALQSIHIPDSVVSIGEGAFCGCSSLTKITVGENNRHYASRNGVLYNKDLTTLICAPNLGQGTFTIPDSVQRIGDWAFFVYESLESVSIPDSVTSIGDNAFYGCSLLTSIVIPSSVISIGEEAFLDCPLLTSVTVDEKNPNFVSENDVLYNKDKTNLIRVPNNFYDSFIFPDTVVSIGKYAFSDCNALKTIVIRDGLPSIGDSAFSGCSSLTSITIPDSVTSIGDSAFSGCSSLTSISIPDSVTSIGEFAFSDCVSLRSVTIPESVTSIRKHAFSGCKLLYEIVIYDRVTAVGSGAFFHCALKRITTGSDAVLEVLKYDDSIENVVITNGVTSLKKGAFYWWKQLKSVTIPNSVTSIEDGAFEHCAALTNVTIPKRFKKDRKKIFSNCGKIKFTFTK